MIDLKNAFGEVDHRLIKSVLLYHHILSEIIDLIQSPYEDYFVSIRTKALMTNPTKVSKGVLQGDFLLPHQFNMFINTLTKCIDDERIRCTGYGHCDSLTPCYCFQIADDTALVTATEVDNQALLNIFTKWYHWSGLHIQVGKCSVFGIKHNGKKAMQFKPYLKINNQVTPGVDINGTYDYLGKQFSYKIEMDRIETELQS